MTTEPNYPMVQVAGECFPPHLLGTVWRTAHGMVVLGNYRLRTGKALGCAQTETRGSRYNAYNVTIPTQYPTQQYSRTTFACGDTHQLLPNSTNSRTIGNRHDILHVRPCYIPTQNEMNKVPDKERESVLQVAPSNLRKISASFSSTLSTFSDNASTRPSILVSKL